PQAVSAGLDDSFVVEGHRRQPVERVPAGVVRHRRVDVGRHEPEERGRELPLVRMAAGPAQRRELLEVSDLADVHLLGELPADRLLERLARREVAARERPLARVWGPGPFPEQRLERVPPGAEDDGESDVGRALATRFRLTVGNYARLLPRLSTDS